MSSPTISVLLITARGLGAYATEDDDGPHPERASWHAITKVLDDLNQQTYKDFELIVVTPLPYDWPDDVSLNFPLTVLPPRDNIWTRNRKVAICTQRNTGIAAAKGDLIVNLDDCCVLPPDYLAVFALGWKHGVCAATIWPRRGDWRRPQIVDRPGMVFGFGSYPREAALELNGYDEAYDGAQGLEDADWSTRLQNAGVKSALVDIPDFDICRQTELLSQAVDLAERNVKCCNAAWQTQRVWRQVRRANDARLWSPEALERVGGGPCKLLRGSVCAHHGQPCAYYDRKWVHERHPLVEEWMKNPPIFNLRQMQ